MGSHRENYIDANMAELDSYIEGLYEDMSDKVKSSHMILKLSSEPENLAHMASNDTLFGALARVLREDGRKSLDLSSNIVMTFVTVSQFSEFHPLIVRYKIGATCYKIIEHELGVDAIWQEEIDKRRSMFSFSPPVEVDGSVDNESLDRSFNQSPLELSNSDENAQKLTPQEEYRRLIKKYAVYQRKQNHLLKMSFQLLLNVSENERIEQKMANKGIIHLLDRVLHHHERTSQDLLLVIITFLKKLSIYRENIQEMKDIRIVDRLHPLIRYTTSDPLMNMTLRLLYNLTFDRDMRKWLAKSGIVPRLVTIFMKGRQEQMILKLFYQFSRDPLCLSMFNYLPDLVGHFGHMLVYGPRAITKRATNRPKSSLSNRTVNEKTKDTEGAEHLQELNDLAINLSTIPKNGMLLMGLDIGEEENKKRIKSATSRSSESQFHHFVRQTINSADPQRLKILVNLTLASDEGVTQVKRLFIMYIDEICEMILKDFHVVKKETENVNSQIVTLQYLIILANLAIPDIDWYHVVQKYPQLIEKICEWISDESDQENDWMITCVMLIGTLGQDPKCAMEFIQHRVLITRLIQFLNRSDDIEITLQTLFAIYQFLSQRDGRIILIQKYADIPSIIAKYLQHKSSQVRKVANISLDLIAQIDNEWEMKLREERFRSFNRQWLEMVESARLVDHLTLSGSAHTRRRRHRHDKIDKNANKLLGDDHENEISDDDDDLLRGPHSDEDEYSNVMEEYNVFNKDDFLSDSEGTSEMDMAIAVRDQDNDKISRPGTSRGTDVKSRRHAGDNDIVNQTPSRPSTGYRRRNGCGRGPISCDFENL